MGSVACKNISFLQGKVGYRYAKPTSSEEKGTLTQKDVPYYCKGCHKHFHSETAFLIFHLVSKHL